MSVCSADLLSVAEELLEYSGEAGLRACVSRSYYALYHQAVETADALGLSPDLNVKTSHEKLISRYTGAGKGLTRIGRTIRKQKKLRAMADYELSADLTSSDARLHLAISAETAKKLKAFRSSEAS